MYKKTMVALLAFLFAAPVYATSAQEQVNAKVLSYLKQGKIEALATYLGSFEKCPGDEGTIKEGTVPSVCAKEKFSRKGQVGTNDKAINVTVEAILSPGFTKTVTLNAVRLDKAINDGLGKMYRERFKRDPLTYNKNKYVSFYNTYKETWLKEDVLRVEIRWINNKPSETGLYDEMLYNSTELAMEIRRPISEVNPKYWNDVNDRYLYCVVPEVWEYAVKQKNGKAVFYTFKTAIRNYFIRPEYLLYSGDDRAIKRQIVLGKEWKSIMIGPVPDHMKRTITKVIHQCYEIVNDKKQFNRITRDGTDKYLEGFSRELCDKLKKFAVQDKVYIKNAEELRAEAETTLKTEFKKQSSGTTPVFVSQQHNRR